MIAEWLKNLYRSICPALPEATLKLLAEKGGIKCLADGIIAVENDDLEALRKVLKEAFPEDQCNVEGKMRFYAKHLWVKDSWDGWISTNLPSIPASILVKELEEKPFEWGEVVWFNDDNGWERGVYIGKPHQVLNTHIVVPEGLQRFDYVKNVCRSKPSPLRITPEMIKEKFNCQEFEIVNEKV